MFAVVLLCGSAWGVERSDVIKAIVGKAGGFSGTTIYIDFGGQPARGGLVKADAEGLTVSLMGMEVVQKWDEVSDKRLLQLARKVTAAEDGETLFLLYSFAKERAELKEEAAELEAVIAERFPDKLRKEEPAKPASDTGKSETPSDAGTATGVGEQPGTAAAGMTPGPFIKAPRGTYQGIFRGHPKIFVRDGEKPPPFGISLAELRQRARSAPWSASVGQLKEVPVEVIHYSVPNLALLWLATGNENAAKRAIEIMKQPVKIDGATYMGDHLEAVCMGYDWVYNYPGFTEADKKTVRELIVKAADHMRSIMHDHVWHTRPYAWANATMFAGLALYPEEPQAEGFAQAAIEEYKKFLFPARRMHDGAWQNSMAYGRKYMVRSVFHALSAWSSATGEDLWYQASREDNWAERMLYMLIYACRPDYSYVTYGDFFISTSTAETRTYEALLEGTQGGQNPYGQGFIAELDKKYGGERALDPELAYYYLLFADPAIPARPKSELPLSQIFGQHSMGTVFMRSGWGPKDLFVFFKCGDYFDNHGHFDQGTFEIFYQRPLAVDSGLYGGDAGFDSGHRMEYMRKSIAHNTVVFPDSTKPHDEGGQRIVNDQTINDPKAFPSQCDTADIARYEDTPVYTYTLGDLARGYDNAKVFYRHFVYLKPDVIVIFDAVVVSNPQFRRVWLYHYPTAAAIEGNRFRVVNGGGGVAVETLLPKPAKITDVQGYKVGDKEYPAEGGDPDFTGKGYVMVEPEQVTGPSTYFLHVLTVGAESVVPTPAALTDDGSNLKLVIRGRTMLFGKDGKSFLCR